MFVHGASFFLVQLSVELTVAAPPIYYLFFYVYLLMFCDVTYVFSVFIYLCFVTCPTSCKPNDCPPTGTITSFSSRSDYYLVHPKTQDIMIFTDIPVLKATGPDLFDDHLVRVCFLSSFLIITVQYLLTYRFIVHDLFAYFIVKVYCGHIDTHHEFPSMKEA